MIKSLGNFLAKVAPTTHNVITLHAHHCTHFYVNQFVLLFCYSYSDYTKFQTLTGPEETNSVLIMMLKRSHFYFLVASVMEITHEPNNLLRTVFRLFFLV
jgi:hypothetical protein